MNHPFHFLYGFIISLLSLASCSPACDEIAILSTIPPTAVGGSQVLIQSTNTSILKGGQVTVNNTPAEIIEFRAEEPMAGLIVQLPEVVERATANIVYIDPDCGEIPVTNGFDLLTEDTGFNSEIGFIAPAPPSIIIPIATPPPPPIVQNNWFSPDNSDYCIWFRFLIDENGDTTNILEVPINEEDIANEIGSAELAVCTKPSLFHNNPVWGIIIRPNGKEGDMGYINFTIDRRNNEVGNVPEHLKLEEFEGHFFNNDDTPQYPEGGGEGCGPLIPEAEEDVYMMVIYSKQTGRPLVLFQGIK